MINDFNIKKDIFLSRFINFYICFVPIYYILNLTIHEKCHYIFAIIVLLFFLFGIKYFNGFKKKAILYLISFLIIFLIYSFLGYMGYIYNWIGMVFMLLCCAFPWFIVGLYVDDFSNVIDRLKKILFFAWITNILLIVYCQYAGRPTNGNMEISYSILPLCILSLYFSLKCKKTKYIVSFIISILIIIGVGSRGPLLCILAFFILYLMNNFNKNKILIFVFIIISAVLIFNYNAILDGLIEICQKYEINSRTIYKIKNGTIKDDNGRIDIQKSAIEQLNDSPFFGTGIGVERIKINNEVMRKDIGSSYPHNFIIEIVTQYGYIIGSLIIIYLIYLFIKTLLQSNIKEKEFIIILFSVEIVRLMLSSSYLRSPLFFLWLGSIVNIVYRRRVNEEYSNNITNGLTDSRN